MRGALIDRGVTLGCVLLMALYSESGGGRSQALATLAPKPQEQGAT